MLRSEALLAATFAPLVACSSSVSHSDAPASTTRALSAARAKAVSPPPPEIERVPAEPEPPPSAQPQAPPPPTELRLSFADDAAAGSVAVSSWLASHGIERFTEHQDRLMGCRVVRLGEPARDGLVCDGGPMKGSFMTGESVFPFTVWAVSAGALRVALEVPIAAGPLVWDFDESEVPGGRMYVELDAKLSERGDAIDISERPGKSCALALAEHAAPEFARHRAVIRMACASAGHYSWSGGRFVRAAPARSSKGVSGF
jgi:hypothetical protein